MGDYATFDGDLERNFSRFFLVFKSGPKIHFFVMSDESSVLFNRRVLGFTVHGFLSS